MRVRTPGLAGPRWNSGQGTRSSARSRDAPRHCRCRLAAVCDVDHQPEQRACGLWGEDGPAVGDIQAQSGVGCGLWVQQGAYPGGQPSAWSLRVVVDLDGEGVEETPKPMRRQ